MNDAPDFYIDSDEESAPVTPTPASPEHDNTITAETSRKEYMKFLGIILFLAAAGTLMSTLSGFNWEEWMRWFMGGFFIVFGSFKLIGLEAFVPAFRGYDLIARKYRPYPYVFPFIEIFLGSLYILNLLAIPRDIVAIALMAVSAVGVSKAIAHKSHIQCACLGTIIRLPLTTVSLVENLTMGIMALIMLLTTLFA